MTKKTLILAIAISVVTLTFFGVRQHSTESSGKAGEALAELHDFNRESLKGHYYLLHFWAKWCEPCAEEIPHLVQFARSTGFPQPLLVVAVSLDPTLEESKSILPAQGKDLPANFLLAHDPDHRVAEKLGSYQYPETYLVGPEGQILEKWIGAQKWEKPEVLEYFKQRLK